MTKSPYGPLHQCLERLDALLEDGELTREDILNLSELSAATGLGTREIRTLLRGGRVRDRKVEEIAPRRVNFLYERLLKESGRRPADIVNELAGNSGMTLVWARSLLKGEKCPNVPHLTALADYFEVPLTFFTDSPPAALTRQLRPIVDRLTSESEKPDPLASLIGEHGIKAIAARNGKRPLTHAQQRAIATFVVDFIADEESEQ